MFVTYVAIIMTNEIVSFSVVTGIAHSRASPAAVATCVDEEEDESVTPAGSVLVNVIFSSVDTGLLQGSSSDLGSHLECGSLADTIALKFTFEGLVNRHEDFIYDGLESLGLLFFSYRLAITSDILNSFFSVAANKFRRVSDLHGEASELFRSGRLFEVGNALLHGVNISLEVPGSIVNNGERHRFFRGSALTGVSHRFLIFLGPLGLVDINTRAGIGTQDRDRSLQVLIISQSALIGVFLEVLSDLVREIIIVLGAHIINNCFVKAPYGAHRDGNDEGEDEEEESAGAVAEGNHALLAVDHEESEKSEEQEEGSDA